MNTTYIKRLSGWFLLYKIASLLVFPQIILFTGIIIYIVSGLKFPTFLNVLLIILLMSMILGAIFLCFDYVPKKLVEKTVNKFKESGFAYSFSMHYDGDYLFIDEDKGRIAVVAKGNPNKVQIMDLTYMSECKNFSTTDIFDPKAFVEIGVMLLASGRKYLIHTYNGVGYKHSVGIKSDSELAIQCFEIANEVVTHLQKAKEVSEERYLNKQQKKN